jgi:hypothetical protein
MANQVSSIRGVASKIAASYEQLEHDSVWKRGLASFSYRHLRLTVTGTGGNTVSTTFTVTPTSVTITPITPANQTMAPGTQAFSATASGGSTNNLT